MSEDVPDSFDPQQPDLPTLGVDPDPLPDDHEGEAPTRDEQRDDDPAGDARA
jgi:hypothetical protein